MIELSHSAIICIGDNMEKLKNRYTLGEEIFNAVTHGVGALLSVGGTAVLIVFSVIYSDAWSVVGSSIYGGSLIMLYIMSTIIVISSPFQALCAVEAINQLKTKKK